MNERKTDTGLAMISLIIALAVASWAVSGCAGRAKQRALSAAVAADVVADEAAATWAQYVDKQIARCRALDLKTEKERRDCLGPADNGEGFEKALQVLIAAQSRLFYALTSEQATVADWLNLAAEIDQALRILRPYLDNARKMTEDLNR